MDFGKLIESATKVVHKAAKRDVVDVLNEIDKAAKPPTKRCKVAENIHSLARAPLLHPQGLQVGAAHSITSGLRFSGTEPIFQAVDSILKCSRRASSADYIGKKVLNHRTSQKVGIIIKETKEMKPGREGVLGGGIYLVDSDENIEKKTRVAGASDDDYAMITAIVDLGKCRVVKAGERSANGV